MSLRNYVRKLGKRAAGTWGRVNHKRDMRAASKGARVRSKGDIKRDIREHIWNEIDKDMRELKKQMQRRKRK